jgi:ethanolamine ammonia-lyase small subunit
MLTERELREILAEVLAGLGVTVAGRPEGEPRACWQNPEAMRELLAATPARIGLGRAGVRYDTRSYLSFRMDHAAARDAIFTEVGQAFLDQLGAVILESRVTDRRQYLLRPDLGRRLAPASERLLLERCRKGASVQLLVVDGLSGRAVEAGALDFMRAFQAGLQAEGLADRTGTPIFVRMGRVAVMDQIGDLLKPDLVVELVGERPGLVTAESMSAYFCYRPNLSTVESDRMLISNIHRGGIPPVEAGAYGARLAAKILAAGVSGVKLTQ